MSDSEFLESVRRAFGYVEQRYGFRFDNYAVPGSFDIAFVDFESDEFRLRVGRERGHAYVELQPSGAQQHYDLALLAQLVDDTAGARTAEQPEPTLDALAGVLERDLPDLQVAFGPAKRPAAERRLAELGVARANALFGWFPPR
jgi:hypothetical protein